MFLLPHNVTHRPIPTHVDEQFEAVFGDGEDRHRWVLVEAPREEQVEQGGLPYSGVAFDEQPEEHSIRTSFRS